MKKKLTIKNNNFASLRVTPCNSVVKFFVLFSLANFVGALFFLSCEQPFKAGLGPVIDLQDPVVILETPGAGAYIRGTTEFIGSASDDYKLDSVWFQLSNYPDVELRGYKTLDPDRAAKLAKIKGRKLEGKFYKMTDITGNNRNYSWKFPIDTTKFDDGDFLIKLLVVDSMNKWALTDDIAFYVKNNIPQISLAFPSIVPGTRDGELGGQHLNYDYIKNRPGVFPRTLDTKGLMVGMISDSEGINRAEGEAEIMDELGNSITVELFPPQIRFWQVDMGNPIDSGYVIKSPGVLPSLTEVPWEKLEVMEIGINNMQFIYNLPSVSGQYYGFEIRAQSSDRVHSTANYPRSWLNWATGSADYKSENGYVLIYVREPLEYPALELYRLEDIYGQNGWNKDKNGVDKGWYNDIAGLDKDGNYPYVDKAIASKSGKFTLRMRAYHSGGIASAKVFWEKDDKSVKGRFVWDPVNEPPFPGWKGDSVLGTTVDFSKWGRSDPYVDNGLSTRSFVFTYYDDPARDKIPNTTDFYPDIRGRSKVQVYKEGSPEEVTDTKGVTRKLDFDELPEGNAQGSYWGDLATLPEGTYNLSIYTTSSSNTRIAVPYTATISIDRGKPEVALNYIEGSADDYTPAVAGAIVVNGVIRPKFLLSDSRPVDSGFRTGTADYFKRPVGDSYYSEQAYILIPANQKTALDNYLTTQPWPQFTTSGVAPAIPGVTISKHGPIFDSSCLFKTSNNYGAAKTPLETDALADGVYWLYAFARDNAFNVGSVSFPIDVQFDSDKPVFDFSVGSVSKEVTDPDYTLDRPNDATGTSFITKDGTRNKFSPSSAIRVRIKDDDSLDLGEFDPSKASKISVEFSGSTVDTGTGKIVAQTGPGFVMNLSDEVIKNAFTYQTVTAAGDRRPVKVVLGAISQTALLDELKKNSNYNSLFGGADKSSFNSLPDHIYRIKISVSDYSPAKLVIEPPDSDNPARGPDAPKVKSTAEEFWIAVDSKNPVIDPESLKPLSGDYIPARDTVYLEGTITDENGPFYIREYTIYKDKTPVTGQNPPTLGITLNSPMGDYVSGHWKHDFSFPINMNGNSGSFTFEIKFQDRFGNNATLTQRYSVDSEPPKIMLTKPIETFARDYDDVTLPGGGAVSSENKKRLAVKVVNFSVTVMDDNRVAGVRWWLLPANAGSGTGGLNASGQVTDYDAFPAKVVAPANLVPPFAPLETYYGSNSGVSGFTDGAYGVVDVDNRLFTIHVDTERLSASGGSNGEYRLHIIAIDAAGNVSRLVESPASNVFQTIFVLQEEDKPYFTSEGASKISPDGNTAYVGDSGLVVRGALFENNGFFGDSDGTSIMAGSVRIWFSSSGAAAPLPGTSLGSPPSGYIGPKTIPASALGRQGRNLSIAFNLKDDTGTNGFTSAQIGGDGPKSYIIEATDSPIKKLKQDGSQAAVGDTAMRVSRWKAFSFIYDANPPDVKVTSPNGGAAFGTNVTTDFVLRGYIEDANLKKTTDGKYYFEYYVDDETTRRTFTLNEMDTVATALPGSPPALVSGKHIYCITDNSGKITVYFQITAGEVAGTIIPNFLDNSFSEDPHTLTLVVGDLSGKEASYMYSFTKDKTPPTISYTNIDNANNKSRVSDTWWTMTAAARLTWLRANPLTSIYYDSTSTEKPILTGAFADDISDIAIAVDGSNMNTTAATPPTTFRYWIDYKPSKPLTAQDTSEARTAALIDGSGRNVRWSIYLTANGLASGIPLPDGVHTIVIEVADKSNVVNNDYYMIAFRIDSKLPTATIAGVDGASDKTVFGKPEQQPDPVFTITGTASDANLEKMELRIVNKASGVIISSIGVNGVVTFTTATNTTYTPLTPGYATGDNVSLNWTQTISKALYNSMADGASYDVKVVAYDYYGNKSDEVVWTFTVDKSPPVIEFTNPTNDKANNNANLGAADFIVLSTLAENNKINRLTSENLRIQGKATDATSSISVLESRVEKWNWSTGAWGELQGWVEIPGANLSDKRKEINWTKNLLGQNSGDLDISTAGGASTPEGLYRIRVRAKDESFTQNGTINWTIATDIGNPVVSDYIYFYYDRTNPELTINGEMDNFYSTLLMGGKFVFSGTAKDNNRFAKIEVKIEPVDTADKYPSNPYSATRTVNTPNLNQQPNYSQDWNVTFDDAIAKPDGRYRVTATVYDMTGRSYSVTKAFTLDNTPPGAKFTLPAKEAKTKYTGNGQDQDTPPNNTGFASVIVNGGEGAVITGETWDKSSNNSESGIDQMWFHLGFIDNSTAFPTRAAIEADEIAIIRAHNGMTEAQVRAMSPSARNAIMDTVANYRASGDTDTKGNAWFKLGGSEKPTGFIINNPNIYDWRMEIPNNYPVSLGDADLVAMGTSTVNISGVNYYQIGGLKLYGSQIKVKNRNYTVGSGARQMVQTVTGQAGIYRLPLWIRLVDKVGNVEYYCHDIWVYPDGDIPTTTIFGADNGTKASARGGAISVDGEARSNTSVYNVAFRVFADGIGNTGKQNTDLNGTATPILPAYADVVMMPSSLYDFVPITTTGKSMYSIIKDAGYATTDLGGTSNSRWYQANLSLKGGAGEPLIPWSVILNAEQEITTLISSRGFPSTGSGANDMIRVWLEVFVFNGEGDPIRSSIYQNDQQNTAGGTLYGTATAPKPYVKAFFVKSAAPQITNPNVASWNGSAFVWNTEDASNQGGGGYKGVGTEVRRDKFAVRAILDPNPTGNANSGLGEVSFRTKLSNDPYSTWTTLWKTGDSETYNVNGVKINVNGTTVSPTRKRYNFEYDIDSKATANSTAWAAISNATGAGAWANSGGTIIVQVRIRDNASPPNEAEQTIVVGVDNFAPVADPDYKTNSKVAGTNVDFMGRVYDYATSPLADTMPKDISPRKVSKVYAWFTRTENSQVRYVNINTGARAASPASGTRTMSVMEGRAATPAAGPNDTVTSLILTNRGTVNASRTLPSLGSQLAHNADWVREISESTATPGTRMLWSPVNSAVDDIRWSFNIDTTVLPDGKMTLHYIVEDAAGNASYYNQEISVRNKYPQIDRVTLYTDNNGIGAVYTTHTGTNIASTEYVLNDYRNKMFANYTDPADYTAPASTGKLDSLGYLNSGFISKNQYIGFKLETSYGNRNLNFRLQYVTRQRIVLNSTNLAQMVTDRTAEDPTKINLYTIAWHGDYSNAKWKALGVPIDNPTLGTHFVFNPAKDFTAAAAAGTAEVWKYTAVKTRTDYTPAGQPADDAVVFGPVNNFEFNTANTGEGSFANIPELMGSHPDADDSKPDNPKATAFFLIRVWDTVSPLSDYNNVRERWVNDQLYDAVVVGMNVYLSDTTRPTARLYDPNPYAETSVVGNNIGNGTDPANNNAVIANSELTIRNALDPRGIGQNILRGGLYNTNTERILVKSGHIEPRSGTAALRPRVKNPVTKVYETVVSDGFVDGDSATNTYNNGTSWVTATKDMVSGKIILRGCAWDDQLIREIRVNIGTGTQPPANLYTITDQTNTILKLDLSGTAANNPNYRTLQPVTGKKAWAFEELHWKTGHTAEWAYVWDTESVPNASGTPASDIKVWVAVVDELGNTKGGLANVASNTDTDAQITTDNETAEKFKNTLTFDIVPYITGIERDATKFTTTRSLQGWYSFFRGETNVSIVGYNLKGAGDSALTIRHSASATTPPAISSQTINKITFTVPADAQSGKIILNTSVTVGGSTEALNHRSRDTQSWNREYHSFTEGSDLWINKPYAHIWRTTESGTAPRTYMGSTTASATGGSKGLDHPGMALEYIGTNSGRLHGTWAVYGYANSFYGANDGTNNNIIGSSPPGDPHGTPDISIFNGGESAPAAGSIANIGFSYQGDGTASLFVKAVANTTIADYSANHANIIQGVTSGYPTQRWQNVRISKALNNTANSEVNVGRIYMTAFDARNNSLWYGSRNNTNNTTATNTTMFIDGGNANLTGANGLAAVTSAGQFSAVDYDTTGPVIAYYDQINDTVRIALGAGTTPGSGANQWNRKEVLASTHPLYRGSGRYVSIKVDKSGGIHLAFFNSVKSTVVYAYAQNRVSNFTAYAIDDVVKGGTWTDISVDNNGNPWIVYGDNSRTGNYDGARIAYKSGTTTGIQFTRSRTDAVTGTAITGWEAVSMPANYTVNNDRLNIEAWPPTNRSASTLGTAPGWNAAIGYASDMYRIGYFFYPGYKDGNY